MLLDLKAVFAQCRKLLKRMGDCAGVGIEPDSQTALVDATEAVLGVVAAGVPGAGGVDAVFAITLSEVSRGQVELLWADWGAAASKGKGKEQQQQQQQLQQTRVCPLLLRADVGALAGVRTEKLAYA
jgi:phosphomevalonate kinase